MSPAERLAEIEARLEGSSIPLTVDTRWLVEHCRKLERVVEAASCCDAWARLQPDGRYLIAGCGDCELCIAKREAGYA